MKARRVGEILTRLSYVHHRRDPGKVNADMYDEYDNKFRAPPIGVGFVFENEKSKHHNLTDRKGARGRAKDQLYDKKEDINQLLPLASL